MGVLAGNSCMMADDVLSNPTPTRGMLKPLPHQQWERIPEDNNRIARGPLAGPGTYNFEAWGVPDRVQADPVFVQQGTAGTTRSPKCPPPNKAANPAAAKAA
ncbi:MAG: arabinosyltransferase C-terminal domain-containing protein [Lawsonella clevelandensis]